MTLQSRIKDDVLWMFTWEENADSYVQMLRVDPLVHIIGCPVHKLHLTIYVHQSKWYNACVSV